MYQTLYTGTLSLLDPTYNARHSTQFGALLMLFHLSFHSNIMRQYYFHLVNKEIQVQDGEIASQSLSDASQVWKKRGLVNETASKNQEPHKRNLCHSS